MSSFLYTVLAGLALIEGVVFTEPAHAVPTAETVAASANFAVHEWGPATYGEAIKMAGHLESEGYRTKIENRGGGHWYVLYW